MLPLPSLPTNFGGEGDASFVVFERLCQDVIKCSFCGWVGGEGYFGIFQIVWEEATIWFEGWAEFVLQDGWQAGITGALNADG
eukprot:10853720-Ditylum_brightwellii.AAC.1